ncbi:glycosyltransferase family 2 protein [Thermogymnomonas acidicola]|nr:glycosyltransferase family 2 protein [Thermogymnomonas acidicola]
MPAEHLNLTDKDRKIKIIFAETAKNKSELVEIGVKEASSNIVLFLVDDIIAKDRAETIVPLFKKNQNLGLIHNGSLTIGEDTKSLFIYNQ